MAYFDRFDVVEAYWVLAEGYGLYGIIERLRRMGFKPRSDLSWDTLTGNGKAIYEVNDSVAPETGPWADRLATDYEDFDYVEVEDTL